MAGVKLMFAACVLLFALLFSFGFQPSEQRPLDLADKLLNNNNNNNGFTSSTPNSYVKTAGHLKIPETHRNNGGAAAVSVDAGITDTSPGHSPGVGHSGGPSAAVGPKA